MTPDSYLVLLWFLAATVIIVFAAVVANYVIPFIINSVVGPPRKKAKTKAELDWVKTLTSYKK